jgi:hypothetical protein
MSDNPEFEVVDGKLVRIIPDELEANYEEDLTFDDEE